MAVPTFNELYTSVQADLRNRLNITSLVGKMVLNAFAMVQAAKLKLFYLVSAFVQKNVYPDQADSEEIGGTLERFGLVHLGRTRNPATAGEYKIQVTGSIGAEIPPGTTFKSLDTSTSPDKLFVLDSLYTFVSTVGLIQVRALDLGTDARLEVGDELQITQPLANVDSYQEVITVETTPVEAENLEDYRKKILEAIRLEAQGGSRSDYRLWSNDADGVRTVYPYLKNNEAGSINLYIEANPDDSTDGNGTPTAGIISDVDDVVEFDPDISLPLSERGRRPMTANVYFLPIITNPVDVDIVDLSDVSYLTAIRTAIEDYLFDIRPFIDGLDSPNNANMGRLLVSDIISIIADVLGVSATFTNATMTINGTPQTLYVFEEENIPYLDDLTTS